ncbi:hypothetical protein KUM42_03985 [Modestobacter sp. L9-4]|uniref:hypothetical protein n=1 Tax=Modestobacter sp. L9-4 TaxID=2851567 RepID=UPI001C7639BD|nr:hypothetical protein [Modestobacter sp. L9-4]QXG76720.1 hypothetical protein KUM42_03985 [Modestobacter sp. L9-4]
MDAASPSLFDEAVEPAPDHVRRIPDTERPPVPTPVERWTSLSACVLDAVWSVGADHDRVVVPLVHRVLTSGATGPLLADSLPEVDSHPLPRLLTRFPDEQALEAAAQNRQRTSTRGGVTKADAALRYARTLVTHGVLGMEDLPRLVADPALRSRLDRALSRVPGEGQHGARRSHFWSLCGVTDKPSSVGGH